MVANRGEIAVRLMKTLQQMGISTVAVYAENDTDALHIKDADERYLLKGRTLAETYLNIEQLMAVARLSEADAVHPGYGFLSENPDFARAVKAAGCSFIGPPEEAIRVMGHKSEARALAASLGIPVIEGLTGDAAALKQNAGRLGYPVMVKAAGGGGGKGMRIVTAPEEMDEVLEATQREAMSYFGNPEIYVEKFLDSPRHIEVQLLADEHGNIVHLFERECSLQRRHQKIIEEAPAPNISEALRSQLVRAAKSLAAHIGYSSAGTVEFLVTGEAFYFLEMNTRIQVEHPVTEMITGIDIVKEQLNIAMGKPLPFSQNEISRQGHAIEARIYAEDPEKDFLPSPGKVLLHKVPSGRGVRVDTALGRQGEVSSMYDPMVSKLIFHASGRETARRQLIKQLHHYVLLGVRSNIAYLITLLESSAFAKGTIHTRMTADICPEGKEAAACAPRKNTVLTAAFLYSFLQEAAESSVWQQLGFWRIMPEIKLLIDNELSESRLIYVTPSQLEIEENGSFVQCRLLKKEDQLISLELDEQMHQVHYFAVNGEVVMQHQGQTSIVSPPRHLSRKVLGRINENPALEGENIIKAPMHGTVIRIEVKEGDQVNKGDTLLILESMKMENKVAATAKAFVKKITTTPGAVVSDETPLIHLSSKLT